MAIADIRTNARTSSSARYKPIWISASAIQLLDSQEAVRYIVTKALITSMMVQNLFTTEEHPHPCSSISSKSSTSMCSSRPSTTGSGSSQGRSMLHRQKSFYQSTIPDEEDCGQLIVVLTKVIQQRLQRGEKQFTVWLSSQELKQFTTSTSAKAHRDICRQVKTTLYKCGYQVTLQTRLNQDYTINAICCSLMDRTPATEPLSTM